jgi:hypothetical protein
VLHLYAVTRPELQNTVQPENAKPNTEFREQRRRNRQSSDGQELAQVPMQNFFAAL